jgi:hypothetical protein
MMSRDGKLLLERVAELCVDHGRLLTNRAFYLFGREGQHQLSSREAESAIERAAAARHGRELHE